jgi:coenzyme F420-0:L-glutamate ligase/coenzyme F420-1:gamma-L-glutamate ligase
LGRRVEAIGITGMPLIKGGDDLGRLVAARLNSEWIPLSGGDVIVVAQSVVSRSEGSVFELDQVAPSRRAEEYAGITGKDPRVIEVVLRQSRRVVKARPGFMICETRHGFVCANAGVDASNVDQGWVSVLPGDPDASARNIARSIKSETGQDVPVLISDSEGRPFRRGAIGVAVGVWGMAPVRSLAGERDYFGRELETTEVSVADMICSAAALVMGEGDEGTPAVVVRGAEHDGDGSRDDMLYEEDVFKEDLAEDGGS